MAKMRPFRRARATRSQACREIVRDRLVADDVELGIERGSRERVVRVVRRHDRDGVDAIGALPLAVQHFGHVAVAPRGLESHRGAGRARARGIAREDPCHGAPPAVGFCGAAMHAADPRVRPPADDREAQRPPETLP